MTWREISADPNSRAVMENRRAVLEAARADRFVDRREVIQRHCSGRRVLDLGCVAHFTEASEGEDWLHRFVVDVADQCVGVDIEVAGIDDMRRQGYQVVLHDITRGAGPLVEMGPFDAIVAGELIEHLDCPRALFDMAREVLRPGGHLIVSTPNPYGRIRVRAGQLGITFENVDHVTYIPPTGVAELAERTGGLRLIEYGAAAQPMIRPSLRSVLWHARLWARRRPLYLSDEGSPTLLEWIIDRSRSPLLRGEVMTYLIQRVED